MKAWRCNVARWDKVSFETLLGKIITHIEKSSHKIILKISDTESYIMYHDQDCCESVEIEDICGDLEWLVGTPILKAEERTNQDEPKDKFDDSFTWTFYELATIKGSVTIRWYGTSNGYYSERVNFERVK